MWPPARTAFTQMNRQNQGNETSHGMQQDRFIHDRSFVERKQAEFNQPDIKTEGVDPIINKEIHSAAREQYCMDLARALGIKRKPQPWSAMWPVIPRRRPIIRNADSVLDLPDIKDSFCDSLMDWSSSNYLTVAFPSSIYHWYQPTCTTLCQPAASPSCVKWNKDGTELFVASRNGFFKLMRMETMQDLGMLPCACHDDCHITCAEYHPTKPLIFLGCNKGGMAMYSVKEDMKIIRTGFLYKSAITRIAFSCDGSYLAVTAANGWVGLFLDLDPLEPDLEFKTPGSCRALAWHPWKSSFMTVADALGHMYIYNASSFTLPMHSYTSYYDSAILSLSFNPCSAELVASFRVFGQLNELAVDEEQSETRIYVLSSFDRVVDRMEGHTGRVHYLSWSPDGCKLATSGNDESARIWNFAQQKAKIKDTEAGEFPMFKIKKKKEGNSFIDPTEAMQRRLGLSLR